MTVPARLFLESRYRKLVRDLPQTIFWCPVCGGHRRRREGCARCEGRGKLTESSVQELIGLRLLPAFRARSGVFHGAGREDLDVRMLGRGRPFVYELQSVRFPAAVADLEVLRARINDQEVGRLEIDPFRVVEKARIKELKEGRFDKVYRLGAALERPVPEATIEALAGRSLVVRQRTPARVAHRRADLVRERRVEVLAATAGSEPATAELELRTEHGTYVKEWVSGDEGRSTPSLAELLGASARCIWLDVLEILDDA